MLNGTSANSHIHEDSEQHVISAKPLARTNASQQEIRSENYGPVGSNLGFDNAIDLQSGHISITPMTKTLQCFILTSAKKVMKLIAIFLMTLFFKPLIWHTKTAY